MKRSIAALCVLFCLAACKQPANPPAVVLEDMFTAMKQGNIEEMKKFVTKSDVAMLEAAEKFMAGIDPEGISKIKTRLTEELKENAKHIEFDIKNETIDGDRATVEAEIIIKDTAAQNGEKMSKQKFELVKEDNAWKIALSKPGNQMFNSMKGNMGARKGDLKDGLEKLQKIDPDTLKMLIRKGVQALDSMQKKKNTEN
jgi:hypothetical protein